MVPIIRKTETTNWNTTSELLINPLFIPNATWPFKTLTGLNADRKNEGYKPAITPIKMDPPTKIA